MVELLLDDHIPRVWVVRIVSFFTFLSSEVCFTSTLISGIPATASSAVVVIAVKVSLKPPPRVLLKLFGHTVLLKVTYFIASPASNIDASFRPDSRILLFLLLA